MGAAAAPQAAGGQHDELMARALAHRQQRRYDEAIRDYEAAVEREPGRHDARYMLADLCRERGDRALAKANILQALDLTGWKSALYRRFLSAILADGAAPASNPVAEPGFRHLAERATRPAPVNPDTPLVTVVVPCRGHAPYVEAALRSVFGQTYRPVELIVIDHIEKTPTGN